MAGILGSGKSAAQPIKANGLNITTSANGLPVPILYGQVKVAPNLFWYNDFAAIKQSSSQGGKGGSGGSATSYDYQVALMLGIGEGPLGNVVTVWKGKDTTTLAALNMSFYAGTSTQALWGYLQTHHTDEALAYPYTAYVASGPFDLGSSPDLPNVSFEVQGLLHATGAGSSYDACPSEMLIDFLTNPQYGLGFPAANLDLLSISTGPASYQNYCQATGLWLSAALVSQEAARDTLARWLQLTNSAAFWSGNTLKIVPYGDTVVTGNGVTYTPDVTPVYDLDDDDYVIADDGDETETTADPVIVTRSNVADAKNWVRLEILDRSNNYVTDVIDRKDAGSIGTIEMDLPMQQITAHEICDPAVGAIAAQLILQRSVYIRRTFAFALGWEYCLLEPGDIVTLTDVGLGLNQTPVRITSITEVAATDKQAGRLNIIAEEFPAGVATATEYPKQTRSAFQANYAVAPGSVNAPVIFEPASNLANGAPQVWVAASGGVNWGGCSVHLSVDGTTYTRVGEITIPARLGALTAAIGAVADPDTTSTLAVSLAESPGATLASGSQADADAGRTLLYVDGELMAYETATLTGASAYNLTYLRRGLYGTAVAAHAAGSAFARLDQAIFEYDLPAAYVGQTIYLKFTSFNIYGGAEEDLSTVTAYDYVPTGKGGYIAPPTGLVTSSANRIAADGTAISTLLAAWTASPGPLLAGYELQYRVHTTGGTNAFVSVQLGADTTAWALSPAVEGATYDVQVRAVSGLSPPTYSSFAAPATVAAVVADTSVPPAPSSLSATTNLFQAITLAWVVSGINPAQIARTEVWAIAGSSAATSPPSGASVISLDAANPFTHGGLGIYAAWTYWVRLVSNSGVNGVWAGPVGGITSATLTLPAASVTTSALEATLAGEIALITAPATTSGSIAAAAATAASAASAASAAGTAATAAQTTANSGVSAAAAAQATANTASSLATAAEAQSLSAGGYAASVGTSVGTAVDTVAGGVLWLATQVGRIANTITQAGFVTDATGALVYNSVAAVSTNLATTFSSVTAEFSAVNASIALKADAATVNSQLAAVIAGNTPYEADFFQSSANGWAASGASLTVNSASITLTATGSTPLLAKSGLSIPGNTYNQIVMVVRRLDAGTDWAGVLQYATAGHGYSASYQQAVAQPSGFGGFQTLVWDMSQLADWAAGTVTGLQFSLSTGSGDSFEIQSIQVTKNTIQQLLLSGLQGQINSASVAISGLQAQVALSASATTVANQALSISTLQANVNALTSEISLLSTTASVTTLTTEVNSATLSINSLQNTITQGLSAVYIPAAEAAAGNALQALVDQANAGLAITGAISSATQSLSATVNNGLAAEAAARLDLSTAVAGNSASIAAESVARSSGDSALASQITALTATVTTNASTATGALNTEATTRAAADTALSTSIANLSATVTSNASAASGALNTEATTRASADSALSTSIATLSATVTSNNTSQTSAVNSEAVARAAGDAANASAITALTATVDGVVGTSTGGLVTEAAVRAAADQVQVSTSTDLAAATILGLVDQGTAQLSTANAIASAIQQMSATTSAGLEATAQLVVDLSTAVGANSASIATESLARSTGDSALATQIANLLATVTGNNTTQTAALNTEATARASADSALSTSIANLSATVTGNNTSQTSALNTEATTRASADSALSTSIANLTATVTGNNTTQTSALNTEATARASGDSANADAITALTSTVNANQSSVLAQLASEASTRASADTANADAITALTTTVGSNYSTLAAEISSVTTTANTTASSYATLVSGYAGTLAELQSTITTNASAAAATASAVTTLQSTVGGNTSAIETNATAISGLSAQYTVKVDVNGAVAGFGLASTAVNGTPTSAFVIRADQFQIVEPGSGPGAGTPAFDYSGGNLTVLGKISAGNILGGTITGETVNIYADSSGDTGLFVRDLHGNLILSATGLGVETVGSAQLIPGTISGSVTASAANQTFGASGSAQTLVSATLTTIGDRVQIVASASIDADVLGDAVTVSGQGTITYTITRDGAEIWSQSATLVDHYANDIFQQPPFVVFDVPTAGSHTYAFTVSATAPTGTGVTGTNIVVQGISMTCVEARQ